MSEKDERDNASEEQKGDTGPIKPPTRESDEPPAQEEGQQRGTGDIKPPTE
jgi:hypothetical protein